MSAINLFHAYISGSAVWYLTRAFCRVYDPEMVIGWFRPPIDQALPINDLERYNVRTDGWGLATIALLLLIFTDAVPNPLLKGITSSDPTSVKVKQRYARAAILADIFHHIMTGIGAWHHYVKDTHYNTSMAVGVWGCSALALLGIATLVAPAWLSGLGTGTNEAQKVKAK